MELKPNSRPPSYIHICLYCWIHLLLNIVFFPFKGHLLYHLVWAAWLSSASAAHASTMSTILQQSISSFFNFPRYSRIGSSDSSTEGNTTKLHIWHIFSSKRAREVALILFVILLLAWTSTWLTSNRSLTKPFASGPTTAACPNVTTKESAKDSVKDSVDWSRFAYVQYATNPVYLCNSVMVFEILHRLNSKADRLLMYPSDFQLDGDPETESPDSRLLRKARDQYDVKLKAIKVQRRNSADGKFGNNGNEYIR